MPINEGDYIYDEGNGVPGITEMLEDKGINIDVDRGDFIDADTVSQIIEQFGGDASEIKSGNFIDDNAFVRAINSIPDFEQVTYEKNSSGDFTIDLSNVIEIKSVDSVDIRGGEGGGGGGGGGASNDRYNSNRGDNGKNGSSGQDTKLYLESNHVINGGNGGSGGSGGSDSSGSNGKGIIGSGGSGGSGGSSRGYDGGDGGGRIAGQRINSLSLNDFEAGKSYNCYVGSGGKGGKGGKGGDGAANSAEGGAGGSAGGGDGGNGGYFWRSYGGGGGGGGLNGLDGKISIKLTVRRKN